MGFTNLPPSIALGMEPAEKGILKQRPRPKSEPVVLGWMWLNMVMNALILSAVVIAVYVVALMHFLDDRVLIEDINFENEADERPSCMPGLSLSFPWSSVKMFAPTHRAHSTSRCGRTSVATRQCIAPLLLPR